MASTHTESASGPAPDLLARAFNAAPNGFVLVNMAGAIVAANEALCQMFGYPSEKLLNSSVDHLLPDALRPEHATLRASFHARPEPRPMGAGRVLFARHADGHDFPVEIGLNPLPGAQGMLVLASVVDISERIGLESAFRGMFDGSPYGQLIIDDAGMIMMANRVLAESLGYTPSTLKGQALDKLLPERYRQRHGALMASYRRTGESRMMGQGRDLTALHADGTELPVEIGLSRVRWEKKLSTLVVITDISVRKKLELELRQVNADLQEFTYVASHDLRSPLRGIADLIEWIETDLGPEQPADVQRNLGRVKQRIQRMDRLIDDLLRYARAGRADTEFRQVNLRALVTDILELQPPPEGFSVTLNMDVPPMQAARTPLETVLRNLLSNAVKHHDRPQGHIQVRASIDDNHCLIEIEDDGPGIPVQARERVFKLFQTLTATERGGSGIGLALTKRLVEVHGGGIEVISPVKDGRGACFRFRWPRFQRRTSDEQA
mgnify:CR=1 FL=1